MKKVISIILSLLMSISAINVFADSATSEKMKNALIQVKSKVDIPAELSVFKSNLYEYGNETEFEFSWTDEEEKNTIYIHSDETGRISSYSYTNDMYADKFTDISKDEIIKNADEFMKKTFPEAFENENDCLVLDKERNTNSYYDSSYFNFIYCRIRNGAYVKGNDATVSLIVNNGQPFVTSAYVNFEYDAEFEEEKEEIQNARKIYEEKFPAELLYQKQTKYYYDYNEENNEEDIRLIYRIKDPGYISAYTGETVNEDDSYIYRYKDGTATEEYAMDAADGKSADYFTEEEISELDTISQIKSVDELEKTLSNLPAVNFPGNLELSSKRITKSKDKYYMNLSYNNNVKNFYEYLDARFNAQTGKLISLSHYAGDHTYSYAPDASISKTQKSNAEVQINKFIKKVAADELSNCKEDKTIESYPYVKKMYYRYVNDIKYENNGINIWYNAVDSDIYNYSLNYTDDAVFPNPEGIITREKAYNNMITFSPLKKIYIISDGEYKLCYYHDVSPYQKIDAFTGEPVNFDEKPYPTSFEYNDISGHWAENAINSLGKIGIGFNSKQFEPDAEIKQSDLLRLMASSLFYNDYIKYDDKTLYEVLSYSDIITPQEKNAENYVTREDAFVFMIRMLYLDKVASLSNIFKVEYTDGNLFSEGKLGYAAILSGLNVIKGDGNEIRPKDNITRAETATMVYNYLLNN